MLSKNNFHIYFKFSFLYLFSFILLSMQIHAQPINFDRISTDQGLSQSTITCIIQDGNGFMWFGTQDGLNKYDGYNFTIFRQNQNDSTSISGNSIFDVKEDCWGNLWIGTEGGLDRFNKMKNTFVNYKYNNKDPNSISHNYVVYILEDSKKKLWIATNGGGLNLYNRKENRFIHYRHDPNNPNSISSDDIYTIYEDSRNNLWIGSWHGDLDLLNKDKGTFQHFYFENRKLSDNIIRKISEDDKKNLWIGTQGDGLYKIDYKNSKEYKIEHFLNDKSNLNSLSGNAIFTVLEDSQHRLWVGTENEGLNIFDRKGNKFIHFKYDAFDDKSLSHNSVWSIFEDKTGNIWIGTYAGGINLVPRYGKYFNHFKHNPGNKNSLSNNSVTCFLKDSRDNFWIGTDGGGLNQFNQKNGTFKCFNKKNSNLNSNAVLSIFEDSNRNLWIGTWAGGLNLFNQKSKQFISFTKENSNLNSNNIFSILEDNNGVLWIGSHWGGLSSFDPLKKQFFNYTPENSNLSDNQIRVIFKDSRDNLWAGGTLALNLFNPKEDQFTIYKHDDKNNNTISKGWILTIAESSDSTLWVGTSGGLNKFNYDSKTFTHYTVKDGLPNDVIKGIEEDENGNLWLSTNRGLSMFDPKKRTFKNYDVSDGLQANEFYNYSHYKSNNGEIYFGGINGFNSFYPEDLIQNPYIPPIVLSDFKIFNKSVEISKDSPLHKNINEAKNIELSYKQSVFSFGFTSLNYISGEKNQYAYLMEGFDKDWNYVGTKNTATYTNLDPGEYIFKVKGSNNDGIWNEDGTSVKIRITPPFWLTWWFRLLVLMFIVLIIYTIYKYRIRNIEAHRRELERKVDERTSELKEANIEIIKKANELHKSKIVLEKSKKETDNILENVNEGFFLLDKDLKISSQYSLALESILRRKNLANLNFIEVLSKHLDEDNVETTRLYLDIIFDNSYDETAINDLNPLVDLKFIFGGNNSKIIKYLNFNFKRIKINKNVISELIVTVKDMTQQMLLSQKLKNEEERREKLLQLMLSILDVDPKMLNEFNESVRRELNFIDSIINQNHIEDYQGLLIKIYRAMHLIKGNAKLLKIDYFADTAHEIEDKISDVQKKTKINAKDIKPIKVEVKKLQEALDEMEQLIERIGKVLTHKMATKGLDISPLLQSLENLIKDFSNDLGKKIKFDYKKFESYIIPEKYHLLMKEVLIQLIRNSIAHGIESPEERKKLKKPQIGKIEISTFKKNGTIGFSLMDDGRGLQLEKLKKVALKSGKWNKNEIDSWSNSRIEELIFYPGITTSDKVNMISGRGVGMDGVKHRITEHKGDIFVRSEANKYCEFEICLPA